MGDWILRRCSQVSLVVCFLLFCQGYQVPSYNGEYELKRDLFAYYDSSVRPRRNITEPVHVAIDLALQHILDIDEKRQLLKCSYILRTFWMDEFLTWNEDMYDGLSEIKTESSFVWVPDITFYNSVLSGSYIQTFSDYFVTIYSNGSITWTMPVTMTTICNYIVKDFPFDTQECHLNVGSWSHPEEEMHISSRVKEGQIIYKGKNVEWSILSYTATENLVWYNATKPTSYSEVQFCLSLQREAAFYMMFLYLPSAVCLFTSTFSFFLLPISESRVDLAIAGVLSQTVFLLLIMELLPADSINPPLMSQILYAILWMDSLIVIITVVLMRIHYDFRNANNSPPLWYLKACTFLGRLLFVSGRQGRDSIYKQNITRTSISPFLDNPGDWLSMGASETEQILLFLKSTLSKKFSQDEEGARKSCLIRQWQYGVLVLDRLVFIICIILIISGTLWFTTRSAELH